MFSPFQNCPVAHKFLKCVSSLRIEFAGMKWLTAATCSILLATRVDLGWGKMGEAQREQPGATSTSLSVSSSAQPPEESLGRPPPAALTYGLTLTYVDWLQKS